MKNTKDFTTSSYLAADKVGPAANEFNTNATSDDQETVETNTDSQLVSANEDNPDLDNQAELEDDEGDVVVDPYLDDEEAEYFDGDPALIGSRPASDVFNSGSGSSSDLDTDSYDGYKTNSDRSVLDNDGASIASYTVRNLPDDM